MARETIEAQVMRWPAERRVDLAEKLLASVDDFATEEIRTTWEAEIERRMADLHENPADGIPAEQVMAEARQRLHEARRVSSARGSRAHRLG